MTATVNRPVNASLISDNKLLCEDRTNFGIYAMTAADSTVSSTATGITNSAAASGSPLHPADNNSTVKAASAKRSKSESTPELMRCKRRISFAQLGYNIPQAQQSSVSRRNERERNRVKLVNLGFATLREHVPNGSTNKKMSKVETLRSAVEYIRKLQELLDEEGSLGGSGSPFTDSSAGSPVGFAAENVAPADRNNSDAANNRLTSAVMCPPSSVSPTCSVASSPTPSYTSDYSYEPLSPEEEDLLDFTSWFT